MAKTMRNAFRAALRWRLGPNPVKKLNVGLLLGTPVPGHCFYWVALPLGLVKPQRSHTVNSRLPNKRPSRPLH